MQERYGRWLRGRVPGLAPRAVVEDGVYEARFRLEVRHRGGSLMQRRIGADVPLKSLGNGRYQVVPRELLPAEVLRYVAETPRHPAYLQMFLWAVPRIEP